MRILLLLFLYSVTLKSQSLCPDNRNCFLEHSSEVFKTESISVYGEKLLPCSKKPLTGFFRDGFCRTNEKDLGNHSVCAEMTKEFLEFTKSKGNDLTKPNKSYGFEGLSPGDNWCICASRWDEAIKNSIEMKVNLKATNISTFRATQALDFTWNKRVISCHKEIFNKQFNILRSKPELTRELKLIVKPSSKSGCELIGLDGRVKEKQNDAFSLDSLASVISKMPIRRNELRSNGKK